MRRKKYSDKAMKTFHDLNVLAKIPINRKVRKYKETTGGAVTYLNNPMELLKRLEVLSGSMQGGNNSPEALDEISNIAHKLNSVGFITNEELSAMMNA